MTIRPQDVLLYGGGECLQRFGVLVWRMTRGQDVAATITRSGAVGPFIGKDGVLRQTSANRLRVDWIDSDSDERMDTPTLLLEAARTNLNDSDDLTAWSLSGTPVVTGSVSDPAGGTGAFTVEDNDGAAVEFPFRNITGFTDAATASALFVVRENTMPASGNQRLRVRDVTAGSSLLLLEITGWTDGEPSVTASAGTFLGKRYVGNGYWAIYGQTTAITEANTNRVDLIAAGTASETGSIDVYRVNLFDPVVPSASVLDASETRNVETLYTDFLHAPQEMTVYVQFIERGTVELSAGHVLHIGAASGASDPRLDIRANSGNYFAEHDNGTTVPSATLAAAPSWGDTVELRVVLNGDGSIVIGQSLNAAAESTASDATTAALGSDWAGSRLYLNSNGGSGNTGIAQFEAVKIAKGVKTMAEMRALFAYDAARAVL